MRIIEKFMKIIGLKIVRIILFLQLAKHFWLGGLGCIRTWPNSHVGKEELTVLKEDCVNDSINETIEKFKIDYSTISSSSAVALPSIAANVAPTRVQKGSH